MATGDGAHGQATVEPDGGLAVPAGRRRTAPVELLLEESSANELTIALWRLAFCLIAAVQVTLRLSFDSGIGAGAWVALPCIYLALLYSAALFVIVSRRGYSALLSFVSVTLDVTLVSAGLLGTAMSGEPLFATNNGFAVPLYLLAIALAGLRYNPHVTVYTTALAMVEYAGVVWYAVRVGDLYNLIDPVVHRQRLVYGQFDLVVQLTNLVLIGSGGLVATFGVRRARELRTASVLDALTGLYNRRFFDERFEHEFLRAERYGRSLSVVMIDIDRFKLYNDRHGHVAGDEVLREVADILRDGVRTTDTVARYGGEEFVLLIPETNKAQVMALVERLRERVEAHPFLGAESQPGGALTISLGVAGYPDDSRDRLELLERADAALYAAKRAGRNRVVSWSDPIAAMDAQETAPPETEALP